MTLKSDANQTALIHIGRSFRCFNYSAPLVFTMDSLAHSHYCSILAFENAARLLSKITGSNYSLQAGNFCANKEKKNDSLKGLLECLMPVKWCQSKLLRRVQYVSQQPESQWVMRSPSEITCNLVQSPRLLTISVVMHHLLFSQLEPLYGAIVWTGGWRTDFIVLFHCIFQMFFCMSFGSDVITKKRSQSEWCWSAPPCSLMVRSWP